MVSTKAIKQQNEEQKPKANVISEVRRDEDERSVNVPGSSEMLTQWDRGHGRIIYRLNFKSTKQLTMQRTMSLYVV